MSENITSVPKLVRDLMTVGVMTCSPSTLLEELARIAIEKRVEAFIVLNGDDGHALGVVSQDDIVRTFANGGHPSLTAEQIMSDGVPQIPPDIPLEAAAQIMLDRGIRALFLMHHAGGIEYPAAVITYTHILRLLSARDADDLKDLGIEASRKPPLSAYFERRDKARQNVKSGDNS
jgi:predicted transcriptional regulator